MAQDFNPYFESIRLPSPLIRRAYKLIKAAEALFAVKVEHVFVSEHIDDKGTRHYGSLWMAGGARLMEARDLASSENVDVDCLSATAFAYFHIVAKEYYFEQASDKSRLQVEARASHFGAELRASWENCDELLKFALQHVLPSPMQ